MILTNQWTEFSHGHARTELRLLKSILTNQGTNSEILSTRSDFGDIFSDMESRRSFLPAFLNRGPLYKRELNRYNSQLTKMWESTLTSKGNRSPLVVSSGFWPVLVQSIKRDRISKIHYRLISPPEDQSPSKHEVSLILDALESGKLSLGIETRDGKDYLKKNFGIKAILVPPLSTVSKMNFESSSFGIFWSVTDSSSALEIRNVIENFQGMPLSIKLPVGINFDDLGLTTSRIKLIPNGITDQKFAEELSQLKAVFLPHKGYKRRGSGLVTSMLGSGVFVLADAKNSFANDFSFSKLLTLIDVEDLQSVLRSLHALEKLLIDKRSEAESVNKFILDCWHEFLDITNG